MIDLDALIAEAREFLQSENAQYYDSSLIGALTDALEALLGERDAALAAIERVREIHTPRSSLSWGAPEEFQVCEGCTDLDARGFIYWPCPTVQAINGAPEFEWEYQCANNINTVEVRGDPEVHAEQCSGKIERRRKAGPWLPVEGDET